MTHYRTRVKQDLLTGAWRVECRPKWWYALLYKQQFCWMLCTASHFTKADAVRSQARLQRVLEA